MHTQHFEAIFKKFSFYLQVDLRADAQKIGMPVVTYEQGEQLAKDVGALFIETSAKEGTNINRACKDLVR